MQFNLITSFLAALVILPAAAAPLSIQDASTPPTLLKVAISPDSRNLVSILFNGSNYGLVLTDTENLRSKLIFSGKHVSEGYWQYSRAPTDVEWAGNDLLAADLGRKAESLTLDGKKVKDLGEEIIGPADRTKKDSVLKLVYTDKEEGEIAIVNALTGERKRFNTPKGKPIKWAFDKQGILRAITLLNSAFWKDISTVSSWYRSGADAEWEKIADFSVKDDYWVPFYVPDTPGKLVIRHRDGRDTHALFEYDVKTRTIGAMLAGHPTQDIIGIGGVDNEAFDRVQTDGMVPQQVWFDSAWARLQSSIDEVIPNRVNVLSGDPAKKVLVYSYGDVDPGTWHILDVVKMQLSFVGRRHPGIDPDSMRPKEIIHYASADGLKIPAYLTRPLNVKDPAPTVVLIHGGPIARDYWNWDAEVQLLASRGYVVFQPQFRGSSGFGKKFEYAGFGQWGLAMQDDITAGVNHLVKEGISDPRKICIYGASYGGYAALWGLVKTPELYRCGISFAGVTDIEHMWRDSSDRAGNKVARELMLSRIGDVRDQQEQFAEVSPLRNAAKIQAPVLLMHGSEDIRVPLSHSEKMKAALEMRGKAVEWELFEREGHGIHYINNQQRYFKRLLSFLHTHIGGLPAELSEVQPGVAEKGQQIAK